MATGDLTRDNKNSNKPFYENEDGLFAMPADLPQASRARIITPPSPADERDGFIYEDQDDWQQPLPVSKQQKQPVRYSTQTKRLQDQARDLWEILSDKAKSVGETVQTGLSKTTEKSNSGHPKSEKGWHAYLYVGVIVVCFVCMCIIMVLMMPQMSGFFWTDFPNVAFINGELLPYDREKVALFQQYQDYAVRDVIYPGVFVDGISVGDMTIEEAKAALSATGTEIQTSATPYAVTVAIGDKTWQVDQSNVPAVRNLGNVLERAYAVGRTNTTDIQITPQTPFRQRINQLMELRNTGINLTTDVTYDTEAVKRLVQEIADYVNREPINAQILSFDYKTRAFTFSDDYPGIQLDSELLYNRIIAALNAGQQGAIVTTNLTLTPAAITKDDLTTDFNLIAAYTTDTTSESNRNTNINLACQAINGTALLPGEVFSFNQATGQRTTAKGYQAAGAIAAGQSIEEVGGGICQVSSTIFNAVARADLEIVERSPHAWPSTYVDRGEDATVNWPNLDFKFRNNTDAPVFIITYYNNRKMSAEIWGLALEEGVTIDLESKVVRTMEPSIEVKYVQNPELPQGTSKTTVKSRTGYVVETYKVWYKNGQETKRELFYTSTYSPYQQVVEYN
ncbi:MAG: VanW family protein [Clostridia bacterium]|nr:VanW family protein [Clostridia bacterium]